MEQFKDQISGIESLEVITYLWHGTYYMWKQKEPGKEKVAMWNKMQLVAEKMQTLSLLQGIR